MNLDLYKELQMWKIGMKVLSNECSQVSSNIKESVKHLLLKHFIYWLSIVSGTKKECQQLLTQQGSVV